MVNMRCASHLSVALEPARAKYTVSKIVKMIKERQIKFDTIACRGLSGMLIAPIVAMRLNKPLLVIRKGEETHSSYTVEGNAASKLYLILDDFIDEGGTVRDIVENIYAVYPSARCAGFIAYKRLSFKNSTKTFDEQMDEAWWDRHRDPLYFYPDNYIKALEEETNHDGTN